jgi:hypothetical protein
MLQTERNVVLTGFQPDATKIDNNITPKQINVASLPDNSPVEPALPIFDGFRCNYCDYTTLSKELITRHLRKQHSHRRDPFSPVDIISRHYAAVRVQCWRPASAGKPRQYWTVCEDQPTVTLWKEPDLSTLPISVNSETGIVSDISQPRPDPELYHEPDTLQEYDGWAERTNWPKQFHGRPLTAFLWAAEIRPTTVVMDWSYASTQCPLISPSTDEEKIRLIVQATNHAFLRCLASLKDTPREFRCWLNSTTIQYWDRPVRTHERTNTRAAYIRVLKRLLCYLFRTWRVPIEQRKGIFGIPIIAHQQQIMQQIWTYLEDQLQRIEEQAEALAARRYTDYDDVSG